MNSVVNSVREQFAVASTSKQWEKAVEQGLAAISSTEEPGVQARLASIVSHHLYLIDGSIARGCDLLRRVRRNINAEFQAEVVLATAEARLHRSAGELQTASRTLWAPYSSTALAGTEYPLEAPPEWYLEYGHLLRHLGQPVAAERLYRSLAVRDWHPLGQQYKHILLVHYSVTGTCDALQSVVVPYVWAQKAPTRLGVRLVEICSDLLRDPPGLDRYPFFMAHYLKHRGLVAAVSGDMRTAWQSIECALAIMTGLGTRKGIALCMQFQGLIAACEGSFGKAYDLLATLHGDQSLEYGRMKAQCGIDIARLALLQRSAAVGSGEGAVSWQVSGASEDPLFAAARKSVLDTRDPCALPMDAQERALGICIEMTRLPRDVISIFVSDFGARAGHSTVSSAGNGARRDRKVRVFMAHAEEESDILDCAQVPPSLRKFFSPVVDVVGVAKRHHISAWLSSMLFCEYEMLVHGLEHASKSSMRSWRLIDELVQDPPSDVAIIDSGDYKTLLDVCSRLLERVEDGSVTAWRYHEYCLHFFDYSLDAHFLAGEKNRVLRALVAFMTKALDESSAFVDLPNESRWLMSQAWLDRRLRVEEDPTSPSLAGTD